MKSKKGHDLKGRNAVKTNKCQYMCEVMLEWFEKSASLYISTTLQYSKQNYTSSSYTDLNAIEHL